MATDYVVGGDATQLVYEAGLELKARSQWSYVRSRFLRHRLAMSSVVVLVATIIVAYLSNYITSYAYTEIDINNILSGPTAAGHHWFGTDFLGRDYFTRVLYGIRTSIRVALIVAAIAVALAILGLFLPLRLD